MPDRLARPLVGFALAAAVLVPAWLSLEAGARPWNRAVALVGLALAATVAAALVRRRVLAVVPAGLAAVAALGLAFDRPLRDAFPGTEHAFFGPALASLRSGFLDYFDTRVPFEAASYPAMRGAALLAVFAFALAVGLALVGRRPLLAVALVVVGAGWPTTMSLAADETRGPLALGAALLAVSLAILLLTGRGTRRLVPAVLAACALVALSVAGATQTAVAKDRFLDWTSWDLYDRPDDPVSVRYVWDSNYDGIEFPEKKTTVFTVKVEGARRSLYWRATSLDEYTGAAWEERFDEVRRFEEGEAVDVARFDPLLPAAALEREGWVRQDVRIAALADVRLVGSAQAVRYEPDDDRDRVLGRNGAVVQGGMLERGQRYTVWSYVPRVRPRALARAGTRYPAEVAERYLRVRPAASPFVEPRGHADPLPAYGDRGRAAAMARILRSDSYFRPYRAMHRTALEVTEGARSPYEAAVALEAWFRGSEGGFVYDEQPPVATDGPPLALFLRTKRGYCQQYAGAMALMLRYLGVPSRVAAGFTSGTYDQAENEWRVTDHNAHTWVEVYFPRFGWVPFDPTPGRGDLDVAYSPFSAAFDAAEAGQLGDSFTSIPEVRDQVNRLNALEQREGAAAVGGGGAVAVAAERGPGVAGAVLAVLAGTALLVLLVKELRRRLRFLARDPRALAAACRRDLAGFLADQGIDVPPSATTQEVGSLAEARFRVHAAPFCAALAEARYAPPRDARRGARQARRELRRLRAGIRRSLAAGERLRGAFRLRSLAA